MACGGGNVETLPGTQLAASVTTSEDLSSSPAQQDDDESSDPVQPAAVRLGAAPARSMTAAVIASDSDASGARAMWTWHDTDIDSNAKQKKMLDFAVAHKVNTIFVHSETLLDRPALLARFLTKAAEYGVRVELLFGASEWALAANHQQPLDLLRRANLFVAGLTGARPAGIHFDIEPHALPDWQADPVSFGNQLIDLYVKLAAAKGPGLYINADIAMGYAFVSLTRNGVTKTLSQWMIDATDRTTLMDYRDYAAGEDSIIFHAGHPIAYAMAHGKRTIIGVETTCNQELGKVTFCEEGERNMENQLAYVGNYYSSNSGYGGVAIHDYSNYRKLP
jgi:hypothetical protein